jgi:hypothetical protein
MDDITQVSPAANVIPYIVAAVAVVLISTIAIFGVFIVRPDKDNTALIAIICASITPTSAAILALMKAQETHMVVNSRFDKVVEAAKAVAHKEGVADEKDRQNLMRGMVEANKNLEALRDSGTIPPSPPAHDPTIPTVQAPVNVVAPPKNG